MKNYPKWYLFLVGLLLLPALASPIYLFGDLHPFGVCNNSFMSIFFYVIINLFWVIPTLGIFLCLNLYNQNKIKTGVILAFVLNLLNIIGAKWLFF